MGDHGGSLNSMAPRPRGVGDSEGSNRFDTNRNIELFLLNEKILLPTYLQGGVGQIHDMCHRVYRVAGIGFVVCGIEYRV